MANAKVYLVGKDAYVGVSSDSAQTWIVESPPTTSAYSDIAIKPTDITFAVILTSYYIGPGNDGGILYTTDGGLTYQTAGGDWSTYTDQGFSYVTYSTEDNSVVYVASLSDLFKSTDGGLTFNHLLSSEDISGIPFSQFRGIYTTDPDVVAIGIAETVYLSTDGGSTFLSIGTPDTPNNVMAVYVNAAGDFILATTSAGVYKSTGGSFSSVFVYPNVSLFGIRKLQYLEGVGIFTNDISEIYLSTDQFITAPTSVYSTTEFTDYYFTSAVTGYVSDSGIIYPASVLIYTPDAGITKNQLTIPTEIVDSYGPYLVRVSETIGCGCPPGYTLDSATKQCITNTLSCPEGYTYGLDPVTNTYKCIGSTVPCDTDIVLLVDTGGSISGTSDFAGEAGQEAINYKAFLKQIVDAIELGYDAAGNLNTTANSAQRISSGAVRVGIVKFDTDASNVSNLSPGTLTGGYYTSKVPDLYTAIEGLVSDTTGGNGGTNTMDGLRLAYTMLTSPGSGARINDPVPPTRKLLLVTDGWPNGVKQLSNFLGYDTLNNLPSSALNLGACGSSGDSPNVNQTNFSYSNYITVPGVGNVIQTNFQVNQMWIYQRTMDLAQGIKAGSSTLFTNIAHACDINLVVIGDSTERSVAFEAFVGTQSNFTTPCTLNTKPYNDTVTVANGFLASTEAAYNPTNIANHNCPDVYMQYTLPGSGTYAKLPSNYTSGSPIVFSSDWNSDSLTSITKAVSNSLLCTETIDPVACEGNCKIVYINNVAYCQCISPNEFIPCCYTLTNCETGLSEYTVNTYGLSNDYLNSLEGQVLKVIGLDKCLYVNVSYECANSTEISIDAVEQAFETCEECKNYIALPPCYLLTNCNNSDITLLTNQNLSTFSGKVVELNDYPGLCWTVLKTTNCTGPFTTVGIVQSYDDCECCFQYQCK